MPLRFARSAQFTPPETDRMRICSPAISVLALALISAAASARPSCTGLKNRKMVFVFLVTGKSAEGYSAQEIEKMQAAHLANFGVLYNKGLLKLVGPCRDPARVKRGIALLDIPDTSRLDDCFKGDPYIQSG